MARRIIYILPWLFEMAEDISGNNQLIVEGKRPFNWLNRIGGNHRWIAEIRDGRIQFRKKIGNAGDFCAKAITEAFDGEIERCHVSGVRNRSPIFEKAAVLFRCQKITQSLNIFLNAP
ncbi:hypothetical protein U14_01852 [Candidatus Moduliflexus flocculans]|uniref:Uncharacterized protein n=1 Tax=Candidatus Moduliflexus flocculans TaxID=1499966 RepID=A0A0S6VSZ0_9BACT|nr:hypothetical protein U14_01852 [Candidatus Moduliflexus flocculans]